MALGSRVDFSDFAPTPDGRFDLTNEFGGGFAQFLKGEATIRDVDFLGDLPEFVLTQINSHWLVRMGERIMRVSSELDAGRVPRPVCLADEYALSVVILNTDPPQLDEFSETFPGLRGAEEIFGYDLDFDGLEDPDDQREGRVRWRDRMLSGLLPPVDSHDWRRHDLLVMESYGQGVYDPADPRHPLRWFDRDDLRERCERELRFVRLPKEAQDAYPEGDAGSQQQISNR